MSRRPAFTETQVRAKTVTARAVMASSAFALGLEDARKGIAFDWRNGDWDYERGRLFAYIAPVHMPLRIGGQLNPKALALFEAAHARKLII
jgi:hypothetical protein